jgi:hypothetical protein
MLDQFSKELIFKHQDMVSVFALKSDTHAKLLPCHKAAASVEEAQAPDVVTNPLAATQEAHAVNESVASTSSTTNNGDKTPKGNGDKRMYNLKMVAVDTLTNPIDASQVMFNVAYEGTMLFLYYDQEQTSWKLVTKKKKNAVKAKWGGRATFFSMFCTAIAPLTFADMTDTLDKNAVYRFLLRNNFQTRIVCKAAEQVLLVDVVPRVIPEGEPASLLFYELTHLVPNIKRLVYTRFTDVAKVLWRLDKYTYPGITAQTFDKKNIYFFPTLYYATKSSLRNNTSSTAECFLNYLLQGNSLMAKELSLLYPELGDTFTALSLNLDAYVHDLHRTYINTYVFKHPRPRFTKHKMFMLNKLHDVYKTQCQKITYAVVLNVVNEFNPSTTFLHNLIMDNTRW